MTGHLSVDQINSDQLDQLYDQLDALRQVAHGYCPDCGRGDAAPTADQWYDQRQRAARAEAALARVIELYEQWVKAGPPPLGTPMSRWWDRRLAELHAAILEPKEQTSMDQQEQAAPVDWQAITRDRERELKTVGEQKHAVEQERDGAYRERAHLVAMTDGAVIAPAPDVDEPGWQIAYLTIGGRQCSWHISPRDVDLFAAVERAEPDDPRAQWNGHTTEEKYAGIAAHTVELMQRCGPECSEMHTETGRCEIARNR